MIIVLGILVGLPLLIYVIYKQWQNKKEEGFEDREN
ncbi:MAG: FeoB-associated Cys-rich membrane protein [Flavobacteriaceae bacterium]|nr:FeoB-associated Cys-rich membrane protein [Flavobacteriaceae bacterium]